MEPQSALQCHECLIAGLSRAEAFAHPIGKVERIDTHISTVLLAGPFAYKIKKPVALGFVDFSTLDGRRRFCELEVSLNRRTAPDLYLGVAAITGLLSAPRMGTPQRRADDGIVLDYAVCMRRFDPADTLDQIAARNALDGDVVDRLAGRVAELHRGAEHAPPGFGTPEAIARTVGSTFATLRAEAKSAVDRMRIDALEQWSNREWAALSSRMAARVRDGFIRECHGDLHLANIVLLEGLPVPFDGIEFNPELRFIDLICDIAFTFMDLLDHGLGNLAWRFVSLYIEHTGDHEGLALLRYYAVYRALVRSEVALIRLQQPQLGPAARQRQHALFEHTLALAERLTAPGPRQMLVMSGLSGSGKSSVALLLAQHIGGVRIRSDVERRRLFAGSAEATAEVSRYGEDATARTYARLADAARRIIAAGVPVIVDAAFLTRARRSKFGALAHELDARFTLVTCEAPLAVLQQRVVERSARGTDASEAGPHVLVAQTVSREPLTQQERAAAVLIDTDAPAAAIERACIALVAQLSRDSVGGSANEPGQAGSATTRSGVA